MIIKLTLLMANSISLRADIYYKAGINILYSDFFYNLKRYLTICRSQNYKWSIDSSSLSPLVQALQLRQLHNTLIVFG